MNREAHRMPAAVYETEQARAALMPVYELSVTETLLSIYCCFLTFHLIENYSFLVNGRTGPEPYKHFT